MPLIIKTPKPIQVGERIAALDELKGVALVLVLLYHIGGVFNWKNRLHGEIGVDIFLILSGFALCLTSRTTSIKSFVFKKVWRLLPAYWVALALFCLVRWLIASPTPLFSIVAHVVCVHAFVGPRYFLDINDSFWFISLIVPLYLIFIVVRRYLSRPDLIIATGAVIAIVATLGYGQANHINGLVHVPTRVVSFFAGLVGGAMLTQSETVLKPSVALLASVVIFYFLGLSPVWFLIGCVKATLIIGVYLFFRTLLIRLELGRHVCKVLGFLGILSYEIYLLHQPFIREINLYALRSLGFNTFGYPLGLGLCVGLVVSVLASLGLRLLINRLHELKNRQWESLTPAEQRSGVDASLS